MIVKEDSLDIRTILMHRQSVSMGNILFFYCLERMFTVRNQRNARSTAPNYFISDFTRWGSSEPLEPNCKER